MVVALPSFFSWIPMDHPHVRLTFVVPTSPPRAPVKVTRRAVGLEFLREPLEAGFCAASRTFLSWKHDYLRYVYVYVYIYIYTHLFIYSFFTYRVFPVSSSWMSPLWLLGLLSDHDRAYLESRFWALTSDMFKSSNHRRDLIETEMRAEQLPSTAKKTWIGSATWTLALQWR